MATLYMHQNGKSSDQIGSGTWWSADGITEVNGPGGGGTNTAQLCGFELELDSLNASGTLTIRDTVGDPTGIAYINANKTLAGNLTVAIGGAIFLRNACVVTVPTGISFVTSGSGLIGSLDNEGAVSIVVQSGGNLTIGGQGAGADRLNLYWLATTGSIVVQAGGTMTVSASGMAYMNGGTLSVSGTLTVVGCLGKESIATFTFNTGAVVTAWGKSVYPGAAEQLATDQAEVNGNKAKIWYNETVLTGSQSGTKRASSITNCEAGNIKSGVTIDDVAGSLVAGGTTRILVIGE